MDVQRIVVIGAGTMGAGIAQVGAQAGCRVRLCDVSDEMIERGMTTIRRMLDKGVERGKVTEAQRDETLARVETSTDMRAAAADADLAVEAVPEQMPLKQQIFRALDEACPPGAILASNTSSLSIDEIASATGRPERVVGMHFFNPVPIMKLLELVRGEHTSDETIAAAQAVGERMGKTTITVRNAPGFATSRLGLVLGLEAIRMVEQGVASAADIDTAMALGYAHPMGPLRLTDLVGLDVRLSIAESLHERLQSEAFRPPELLRKMVAEGNLGKKTGRGFYDWND
ncbi:MAG: 3-hydroxyacyl-CoA dehydrogenase NAD-binding domain-containing protein [Candidatus Eisenbacteria bacterium]